MSQVFIAPSILSADPGKLAREMEDLFSAGADFMHLDIMDGNFVPNITFGPWLVKLAKKVTNTKVDAHLMVEDPLFWAPVFAKAGADYVSVHVEASVHLHKVLTSIREHGAKAGVAINPGTPIYVVEPVLHYLDLVVVMGVNPGFSGQPYIPETVSKVESLYRFLWDAGFQDKILIEVDGGVSDSNILELVKAGAQILVSGSYLFKGGDYASTIKNLKTIALSETQG
ncbi:MAG: ribulose-phosphate 3-epimerase [Deltaproteobacteria bacterium]|jgi:ribulose-phosphate 3-epimerase|nr:ribulose-phosphate 3-epimerase [Deltaproteobacteria bacterium]